MIICPYCGSQKPLIEVHGHKQCQDCKINVEPCCGGAPNGCPYTDREEDKRRQQSTRGAC